MSRLKIKASSVEKVILELEPWEARGLKTLLYRGVASEVLDELTLGSVLGDLMQVAEETDEIFTLPTRFETIATLANGGLD